MSVQKPVESPRVSTSRLAILTIWDRVCCDRRSNARMKIAFGAAVAPVFATKLAVCQPIRPECRTPMIVEHLSVRVKDYQPRKPTETCFEPPNPRGRIERTE